MWLTQSSTWTARLAIPSPLSGRATMQSCAGEGPRLGSNQWNRKTTATSWKPRVTTGSTYTLSTGKCRCSTWRSSQMYIPWSLLTKWIKTSNAHLNYSIYNIWVNSKDRPWICLANSRIKKMKEMQPRLAPSRTRYSVLKSPWTVKTPTTNCAPGFSGSSHQSFLPCSNSSAPTRRPCSGD